MGVTPQAIAEQFNQAGAAVINQIKATVKPLGVQPDSFIDWLDKQGSRGAAAYAQALRGQFASVKAMAGKFRESQPQGRSDSDRVHLTPSGRRVVTVQLPNGQMIPISEATAIRMGII